MTTKATINRLATGVPGLDEVLGGGLPEFSFNLIAGQPGSGKTTLAHQIMFALATPERPAIYFTVLGEPPLKMLRYQQQFDWFDREAVNQRVRFVSLSEDAMSGDLDRVLKRIVDEVTAHDPSLIFVDSFRSVVFASENADGPNDPDTDRAYTVADAHLFHHAYYDARGRSTDGDIARFAHVHADPGSAQPVERALPGFAVLPERKMDCLSRSRKAAGGQQR